MGYGQPVKPTPHRSADEVTFTGRHAGQAHAPTFMRLPTGRWGWHQAGMSKRRRGPPSPMIFRQPLELVAERRVEVACLPVHHRRPEPSLTPGDTDPSTGPCGRRAPLLIRRAQWRNERITGRSADPCAEPADDRALVRRVDQLVEYILGSRGGVAELSVAPGAPRRDGVKVVQRPLTATTPPLGGRHMQYHHVLGTVREWVANLLEDLGGRRRPRH
jgi:hypothetical protein